MKRKIISSLLAAGMLSSAFSGLYLTAGAADVGTTWKFDFGAEGQTAESGYIAVAPDVNYTLNTSGEYQYGFIGTNSKDYKLNGGHIDGFVQQEGQVITLTAGGGTGLNDGIGSTGADQYGNAGDKYYPVRFAFKGEEEAYYKVKATVTTLDTSKPATASLYTERKHPLYTEKTIPAGETVTKEFTVRPTPIFYKGPATQYADEMVNVCVLGENTALAAIEIEKIETAPVLWVLGDSTVTDGGGTLPFFPLQNYTGVGTGLTKYLPSNIAMVNEGEGGLSATDGSHFNMVKNRIKAGDYMYVEYGHNHKTGGVPEYVGCLDKYWQACKAVGATLILVGPIDRTNNYDSSTNTWSTSLAQFSRAAKAYVDCMRYGGETAANTYVSTYKSSGETAAAEYMASVLAENTTVQVSNIAFVDLNEPSLRFFETRTESGVVGGTTYTNNKNLMNFYFRTGKNTSTDNSHPNDTGAENLIYRFFTTADTTAYPELKPLLANFADGAEHEEPTLVSPDIINMGWAGKSDAWPTYVTVAYDYPLVIKQLVTNEDGKVTGMKVYKQDAMETYSSGVIEIGGTQYVTQDHIDNTWDNKNTYDITFAEPVTLADGYKAYMWSCSMDEERLLTAAEGGVRHSADFVQTDIEAYLLPGDDTDIETFDYYGKSNLTDTGKYTYKGSAAGDFTIGEDDGRTYATIAATTGGNSYWLYRPFENLSGGTGTKGRYLFDADIKYYSGWGLRVSLAPSVTSSSPYVNDPYELFTINTDGKVNVKGTDVGSLTTSNWVNLRYILDMSAGTASVSINGSDAKVVPLPDYAKFETPSIASMNYLVFTQSDRSRTFKSQFSNLTVAKLSDGGSATINVAVDSESDGMGTAYVGEPGTASQTVATASAVSAAAVANDGYTFAGWYEGDTLFSDEAELSIARLYRDLSLTAKFRLDTAPATVTVNYVDGNGNALKTPTTITEVDGKQIYSQTAFALSGDEYTATIKKTNSNGLYDVYVYDSSKSDALSIASLNETNTINIVFNKLEGAYYHYDDCSGLTAAELAANGWTADYAAIQTSEDHGNYIYYGRSDNKGFTAKKSFTAVDADKALTYTFEADVAVIVGNTDLGSITVNGSDGVSFLTLANTEKSNSKTTAIKWSVNGVESDTFSLAQSGIGSAPWTHIKLVVNTTTKNVDLTISQSGKDVYTKSYTASSTGVITGITVATGRSYPRASLDNVMLYTVLPAMQDEVSESGDSTINGTYDGESATVPANATVTIADGASITNGTLTAKDNGTITVVVDGSTISNASSVQFDDEGKVTPSDGAVISTPNGTDGKTDKGFFITKSLSDAAETTFKINGEDYNAAFGTNMTGEILFGIFVTGIPENANVTVK